MFENDKDNEKETSPQGDEYEAFAYNDEEELSISPSYANRMLQKKRLERKMRKGNIWIARLHVLLRLIILAGLIYGLYILIKAPQWYVDKDIFTSTSPNLEIINNNIVPTYKILNELRKIPVTNEPIYKFETDKIRINLLELEPIEDIYIRRFWFPARLKIIIKERVPLLSIHNEVGADEVAYFTKDGVLISGEYLPLPKKYTTSHVIASGNFREWNKSKIDFIAKVVNYTEQITKEPVSYIDLRQPKDIYIELPSATLRVGELDEGVTDRISRLASVLPKAKQLNEPIQYIDLRWKNAIYFKKGNRHKTQTSPQPETAQQEQTTQTEQINEEEQNSNEDLNEITEDG